jgi:hypothetical protein
MDLQVYKEREPLVASISRCVVRRNHGPMFTVLLDEISSRKISLVRFANSVICYYSKDQPVINKPYEIDRACLNALEAQDLSRLTERD